MPRVETLGRGARGGLETERGRRGVGRLTRTGEEKVRAGGMKCAGHD